MGVSSLGEAFTVVMRRHGWTGAALARKIGVSQPWVSMVLAGKRDPGMARSAGLLRLAGWELELIPSEEEDPVKRRRFLASAASVAMIPSMTGSKPYSDPSYVQALGDRLAHTEEQIGGAPLVREAIRHVHHIAPAVSGKDTGLQSAASGLARRAALVLHDTRHLDRAEEVAVLALTLAAKARDVHAQAHAYATLSLIRTYGVPTSRAAEYVQRGLALYGLDDATRAMLLVRLGRSLAVLPGQERPVRRALDEAQSLAGQLSPVEGAEIMANSGIALSDCGLHTQGAADLQSAVSLEAQSPLLLALYQARLTKSAMKGHDVPAAADAMNSLSLVVPLVASRRLEIHVRHILTGTRPWVSVREIREAREQLREVAG